MDYLTVAEVRDELGDLVESMTDSAIRRRLDRLSAYMEQNLGHAFGRCLVVRSAAEDTVSVTSEALIVGGDTYTFADYATLAALVDAANAAGAAYSLSLLSVVAPDTPSTLLKSTGATACGPAYADRVVLDLEALWVKTSGDGTPFLFLPLPVREIVQVVEDGVTLDASVYQSEPAAPWLERKIGSWSTRSVGNIQVTYKPPWWGIAPPAIAQLLLDAFQVVAGLTPVTAERFGDYSYQRQVPQARRWEDILAGRELRPYTVRFHP